VVDVDLNSVYARTFRWYLRPQPDEFRTPTELSDGELAQYGVVDERLTDGLRTLNGRSPDGRVPCSYRF